MRSSYGSGLWSVTTSCRRHSIEGTRRRSVLASQLAMKSTVFVTGDIVLDCHLYSGLRTVSTSSGRGTVYNERLGGAAMTRDLIEAAVSAGGTAFDTHLALATMTLPEGLPRCFRSYGVWT